MKNIDFYIKRYQLKNLGEILGKGATTVVIKVHEEFNISQIENAVLHITREPQKFNFLSTLFKNTSLEIEKFNLEKMGKDLFYYLEEEGLSLYFTTEMIPQTPKEQKIILNTAMDDICTKYRKKNFNSKTIPIKEIMNSLTNSIDEFTDKMNESELNIFNAIEKALLAISKTKNINDFKLDLHWKQFCSHEGKLYCIDPMYFGEF